MHLPSAMSGEDEVKNFGFDFVSLRQTTLPLAASRQETVPPTPRVQTLPSPTAGLLRGPLNPCAPRPAAGPLISGAAYLSFQSSLPLAASRQVMTSSPPWRAKA